MIATAARTAFWLLLACGACPAQQYVISTLAGAPVPPVTTTGAVLPSIPASHADLGLLTPGNLAGLAADSAGNLYYSALNCIVKLDRNGVQTRIAGTSRAGYSGDGGPAVNAQINSPGGLAVDRSGNLFFSDNNNFRIRRVDTGGIITTVAGNGVDGFSGDGGPAVDAAMRLAGLGLGSALAIDNSGNLFIADTDNQRIRKVTPDGIVTTVVRATGAPFNAPGIPIGLAQFFVNSLAVDSTGDLFFAESGYNNVYELLASGTVTRLTGGGGTTASISPCPGAEPNLFQISLAVDGAGNLFYGAGCTVREYSTEGVITTVAGNGASGDSGDGGPAASAGLATVLGLAMDGAGNIFVASSGIREISSNGTIHTLVSAGNTAHFSGDGGNATAAQFYNPEHIAVDSTGNVYVSDDYNVRIRRISSNGIVTTVAGTGVPGYSGDGGPGIGAQVAVPAGLATDASGNLYLTQVYKVRKLSPNGTITTFAGGPLGAVSAGTTPCALVKGSIAATNVGMSVVAISVDSTGNLYIVDGGYVDPATGFQYPPCIDKVTPGGALTVVVVGCCNGIGSNFGGVALDAAGNLLAIKGDGVVKISLPAGTITAVAGATPVDFGFAGDGGPAVSAFFRNPTDIALDSGGNLYISDAGNYRVRKVTTDGIINTIAGQDLPLFLPNLTNPVYVPGVASAVYSGDSGPATIASLGGGGLAIDHTGNVYVADTANNAVRVLRPASQSTIIAAVVDAASESAIAISPGKIVVIYGAGLGPAQLVLNQAANGVFGSQAGGTTVSFNGTIAPLIYSLATQVAAIVPYEISGAGTAQVTVAYQGQTSAAFTIPVAASAPSFFSLNGTGAGQAAAVNVDGSINDAAHSVAIGGYISLFATGEGQTSPAGVDGELASTQPYPQPLLPVKVTVGGIPALVIYAGAAPTEVAGLMQVVVQIPQGVQPGGNVPVTLQVGTASSVAGAAWIAVSQ